MKYNLLYSFCYKFAKVIDYKSLLEWVVETDPGHVAKYNINALSNNLSKIQLQLLKISNLLKENFFEFIQEEIYSLQDDIRNFIKLFEGILNYLLYTGVTVYSYQMADDEIMAATFFPGKFQQVSKKANLRNILQNLTDAEDQIYKINATLSNFQSYPQKDIEILTEKRISIDNEFWIQDEDETILSDLIDIHLLEKILHNFDVWIKFCDLSSEFFKILKLSKLSNMFSHYTDMISDQKDYLRQQFMPIFEEHKESEIRERVDKPDIDPEKLKIEDPEYYEEFIDKEYDPTLTEEELRIGLE